MKVCFGKTKVMVSGLEGEIPKSKVDLCAICGKRVVLIQCYAQIGYMKDPQK